MATGGNPSVDVNPAAVAAADEMVSAIPPATETPATAAAAAAPSPTPASLAVAAVTAATSGANTPGGIGTTGTLTPALDPEQVEKSLKVSLADLTAKATALYAHKSYEEAAEVFAQAAEMQAEINGEMNSNNAEILFLYGRSLCKVGQSKSDVFGGKVPEGGAQKKGKAAPPAKKAENDGAGAAEEESAEQPEKQTLPERVTEEGTVIATAATSTGGTKKEETVEAKKPLFQFTGDENWDDSDEEEEAADGEEGEEEEEDDLAVAFEILDMARVLFNKKLEETEAEAAEEKGKEKEEGDSPALRHIKERLADTHDLLAELSLEAERYADAIPDSRKSLEYKKALYPEESEIIAEAHFKLSLALEFASVVTTEEADKEKGVDQALREEAATELEAAIASTKLKLQSKEVELAMNHSPEDNDVTRKQITDVKEVIADMEQRLVDLRALPMDIDAMVNGPEGNPLGGILGAAFGESAAQKQARIEEAKRTATDLTGLVRKKAPKPSPAPAAGEPEKTAATNGNGVAAPATETNGSNGKRKLEETEVEPEPQDESKKIRVEDAPMTAET